MSIQTPESITRVLLAALNAADDIASRSSDPMGSSMSDEAQSVAAALAELVKVQASETPDDRQNRFAATICLSMTRLRSAT